MNYRTSVQISASQLLETVHAINALKYRYLTLSSQYEPLQLELEAGLRVLRQKNTVAATTPKQLQAIIASLDSLTERTAVLRNTLNSYTRSRTIISPGRLQLPRRSRSTKQLTGHMDGAHNT